MGEVKCVAYLLRGYVITYDIRWRSFNGRTDKVLRTVMNGLVNNTVNWWCRYSLKIFDFSDPREKINIMRDLISPRRREQQFIVLDDDELATFLAFFFVFDCFCYLRARGRSRREQRGNRFCKREVFFFVLRSCAARQGLLCTSAAGAGALVADFF